MKSWEQLRCWQGSACVLEVPPSTSTHNRDLCKHHSPWMNGLCAPSRTQNTKACYLNPQVTQQSAAATVTAQRQLWELLVQSPSPPVCMSNTLNCSVSVCVHWNITRCFWWKVLHRSWWAGHASRGRLQCLNVCKEADLMLWVVSIKKRCLLIKNLKNRSFWTSKCLYISVSDFQSNLLHLEFYYYYQNKISNMAALG